MNNKEDEFSDPNNLVEEEINWDFCPYCGTKLTVSGKANFCTNCGLDLEYVKQHKKLPPKYSRPNYAQPQTYSQYPSYQTQYYRQREILSDDEILDTKGRKLWGVLQSIGYPLLAFLIMNGIIIGIVILLLFTYPAALFSPIFMVTATFAELLLIVLPLWYVRKYLKNPSLENRLTLLGFTRKGFTDKELLKEIFIGVLFAVIGILLVAASSAGIRFILEFFFRIRIIESGTNDSETLITGMDVLFLILMIIMMILVVGPTEEILFRGFCQRGLVRSLGETWGIFITACFFAVIHLVVLLVYILTPIVFVILFIVLFIPYLAISLLLGLLFKWRNENLVAVIVTHGVYNSLTLIISFLFVVFY
ncbi:MAG: CPBP family intramembrane glutamic endopeptidase [Candidatus Hermodarchaeota archaeon]